MEDNITVLADAKIEYTKQLTNILIPFIFEGIKSIYNSTVSICNMNQDAKVLMRFQEQLSQIPKWNQEIIDEEYERIIEDSKCDWLDDLVTAVFLSHTKILTAIKSGNKQNKINLKIPKIDHFIHRCYIESAREFWKNPYIFSSQVSHSEYQRNINDGHRIIGECIEETIRKLLPVKNILREYLGSSFEDSKDNESMLPDTYKENLKKMVQKELEIVKNPIEPQPEMLSDIEEIESVDIGLKKKEMTVENLDDLNTALDVPNKISSTESTEETVEKNEMSSSNESLPEGTVTDTDSSVSSKTVESVELNSSEPLLEEITLNGESTTLNSKSTTSLETDSKAVEVVFEEPEPVQKNLGIQEVDLESINLDSKLNVTETTETKEATDANKTKKSTDVSDSTIVTESTDVTDATIATEFKETPISLLSTTPVSTTDDSKELKLTETKDTTETTSIKESKTSVEPINLDSNMLDKESPTSTIGDLDIQELSLDNFDLEENKENNNFSIDNLNLDEFSLDKDSKEELNLTTNLSNTEEIDLSSSINLEKENTTTPTELKTEPVSTEPVTTEPVSTEPVTTEPVTTEPVSTEPVTTEPVSTEPVTTEPVTTELKTDTLKNDIPITEIKSVTLTPEAVMDLVPAKKEESKTTNENKTSEEAKEIKDIINHNAYQNNLATSDTELSEDEARIENIKFKKSGLDNLDLENLDSDFEIDDGEIVSFKAVEDTDISTPLVADNTLENLTEKKNTKTIIIEDDKSAVSKYSKPKKKSFKFFD